MGGIGEVVRNRCKTVCSFGLLALLVLLLATPLMAQLPTGTILGVVKDSSGAVVPNATVTILNTETGASRAVTTGDDGAFRVPALLVGRYSIKTEKDGFKSETQTGLTLEVGQDLVVNTALQVGSSTQEVMVTAEAPVVNTTNGTLGTLVNEEKMADLPLNGRNWVDLVLLQPGVDQHKNTGGATVSSVVGTWMSVNGATTRSNNFMLDGAMMANVYGTSQASVNGETLGVDGIRELRVVTNSFSAEYGLMAGSQTVIVSKGGSNQWHGSVFDYLRNSALDAANLFDTPANSGGGRLPPFKRNQFGASFGGPIRKDKTFFYGVFEGVQAAKGLTLIGTALPSTTQTVSGVTGTCRQATSNPCAVVAGTNPTGIVNPVIVPLLGNAPGTSTPYFPFATAGLGSNFTYPFNQPVSEQYGQMRVDQNFSDKDTAFGRYTIDTGTLSVPPTSPNPLTYDALRSISEFLTASETHIFSPTLLSTLRFSLSRQVLQDSNSTPDYPCTGAACSFIPGQPSFGLGTINVGGGVTPFGAAGQIDSSQKIWAWSDDMYYTHGRHALKFGYLGTFWDQHYHNINTNRGTLTFTSLANFMNANYSNYTALTPGSSNERNYHYGTVGLYFQDDIRVTSRFTLNAGIRYEFLAPNYHEITGLGAALRNPATDANTTPGEPFVNPSLRAISPRLGFAWDVRGDGKTSVRGGAGRLYDIGGYGTALSQGASATPVGPVSNGVGSTSTTVTGGVGTGACTSPVLTIPFAFPSCWTANTLNLPDYNMKQASLDTYNLTIERQLFAGIGLSVGYAGSRGNHLINRQEGNPCIPEGVVNGLPNWVNTLGKGGTVLTCPLGRVNPHWGSITMAATGSSSWYNSMQIVATKRISHGFQFQGNYTWGKILDTGTGEQSSDGSWWATDPGFPQLGRGPASYNVAQNFRFNAIYFFPKMSTGGFVGGVANGWRVSAIVSVQTGYPFSPADGTDTSGSGALVNNADLPNLLPGRNPGNITSGTSPGCGTATSSTINVPTGTPLGTTQFWYDPCAFQTQTPGNLGTTPRNFLTGPGTKDVDFSLVKETPVKFLGEGGMVEFRTEFFNLFNHPNLGMPGTSAVYTVFNGTAPSDSPVTGAGQIKTTSGTSRQIQFALRLTF